MSAATGADWDRLEEVYAGALRPFAGRLDPAGLIAEAEAATGLADWGGEERSEAGFRRRFRSLCAALEEEGGLSDVGRSRAHGRLHAMLVSRLRVCAFAKSRPASPPIVAPLVGTGLPRTGSSFLQGLLAQDPDHYVAIDARALVPVPPQGDPAGERRRFALADRLIAFQGLNSAEIEAIHPHGPDVPAEDVLLQEGACGISYRGLFNVPSFEAHGPDDAAEMLRWQKGLMELMQPAPARRRWVLKAPAHMADLSVLYAIFPDAKLVVTHRDPAKVIPSLASLYLNFRSLTMARPGTDLKRLGRAVLAGQVAAVARMNAWRDANPHVPVVDVQFAQLVEDPLGEAERLYRCFGLHLGDPAKSAIALYLADHRHGGGGCMKHDYRLADFGLSERMIDEAFGAYVERYGVRREENGGRRGSRPVLRVLPARRRW